MIEQELREKVADIVRSTLVEHFADKFVFDPIKVIPAIDEFGDGDGEAYLRIMIVWAHSRFPGAVQCVGKDGL